MMLHEKKFELMTHHANRDIASEELPFHNELYTYNVSADVQLTPTRELRDLGITISSDLSWLPHINKIVAKAQSVAAWVLSVFRTRNRTPMITLYKSMVRSHLEYCCPLWHPCQVGIIQKIENVQRQFLKKIDGYQSCDYWQQLKYLGLMSLQRRRERYIILIMWQILNNLLPNDIDIRFRDDSRRGIQAILPALTVGSRHGNQTKFDNSFAMVGPQLWNVLPHHLTIMTDAMNFKNALTSFLKSLPDEPPINRSARTDTNSLCEVIRRNTGRSRI